MVEDDWVQPTRASRLTAGQGNYDPETNDLVRAYRINDPIVIRGGFEISYLKVESTMVVLRNAQHRIMIHT